jgi:hypothetical protein
MLKLLCGVAFILGVLFVLGFIVTVVAIAKYGL